ncbi:MAG: hypothetical protein A4E55_02493 [Pelotomaculum sp. PtaU1.Bin035]|nr:MAG: hypothetical protein A4E55_02493 [Pelotomaculum sp. PtaU1.Bin035]
MSKEQSATPQCPGQALYSRLPNVKLPENYATRDGFLRKGNTIVSLLASGIVEAAAQGFLHVDEAEEYKTG